MPAQSFRMQTEQRSVRAQEGGLRTSLSFLELVASAATLVNAEPNGSERLLDSYAKGIDMYYYGSVKD